MYLLGIIRPSTQFCRQMKLFVSGQQTYETPLFRLAGHLQNPTRHAPVVMMTLLLMVMRAMDDGGLRPGLAPFLSPRLFTMSV